MLLNLNVLCFLCYPLHNLLLSEYILSPATDEGKEISHSNEVVYCCFIEERLQKRWNYNESNKIKESEFVLFSQSNFLRTALVFYNFC